MFQLFPLAVRRPQDSAADWLARESQARAPAASSPRRPEPARAQIHFSLLAFFSNNQPTTDQVSFLFSNNHPTTDQISLLAVFSNNHQPLTKSLLNRTKRASIMNLFISSSSQIFCCCIKNISCIKIFFWPFHMSLRNFSGIHIVRVSVIDVFLDICKL